MQRYSKNIAALVAVCALAAPALAAADTLSDLQNQIQVLLAQVHMLQQQMISLKASSTAMASTTRPFPPKHPPKEVCAHINRGLRLGMRGDDVRELQDMLHEDDDVRFMASSTGVFGPATAQAMARWQMKMGIASSTDGSVGSATRAFFMRMCGGMPGKSGDDHGFGFDLGEKMQNMTKNMMGYGENDNGTKGHGDMMERGRKAGGVAGTITASSALSITVQMPEQKTRVVLLTASTTINLFGVASSTAQLTAGTTADLVVGRKVKASGTANADGSLTAQTIVVDVLHVKADELLLKDRAKELFDR